MQFKSMLMKVRPSRSTVFIGKSMLWSLLLYVVMMLAFNWDEVRNTIKGGNAVTIVTSTIPPYAPALQPANISADRSVLHTIVTLLSGVAKFVTNTGYTYDY